MRPPITESPYFLALFANRFYLVSKCTLFDTTSLKMGIKKKVYFNLPLNFILLYQPPMLQRILNILHLLLWTLLHL